MFKKILVGFDLSEESRLAAHHAAGLASRTKGATITLLHVDDFAPTGVRNTAALATHIERTQELRTRWVARVAGELEGRGASVESDAVVGRPAEEILEFADRGEFDLIVVGRRGLGGFERLLVGSTSKRIATHSPIPVLVVPEGLSPSVANGQYQHICVSTDLSDDSAAGVHAAKALADSWESRLTVVHVSELPTIMVAASDPPFILPIETRRELELAATKGLDAWLDGVGASGIPAAVRVDHDICGAILAAASDSAADLVAVSSHGKGAFKRFFIGSITLSLLKRSDIPVLVIPRPPSD